jgi:hypothetical protein
MGGTGLSWLTIGPYCEHIMTYREMDGWIRTLGLMDVYIYLFIYIYFFSSFRKIFYCFISFLDSPLGISSLHHHHQSKPETRYAMKTETNIAIWSGCKTVALGTKTLWSSDLYYQGYWRFSTGKSAYGHEGRQEWIDWVIWTGVQGK